MNEAYNKFKNTPNEQNYCLLVEELKKTNDPKVIDICLAFFDDFGANLPIS